jgi:hypothetical protein
VPPPAPDAAALQELAAKYQALAALRARRDAGTADPEAGTAAARAALRALAERHPGCLRELDTLGAAELERRARVVAAAAGAGPRENWMAWIWAYHRLMRATLGVRRALGRTRLSSRGADPAVRARLLEEASRTAGWPLDDAFVAEVAAPPQRRLGVVVLARLAAMFGVPAREIAQTLFPPRRPPPYSFT